jgi:hypothetical protein
MIRAKLKYLNPGLLQSSNLVTIEATKFGGPHKSYMCHNIIELAHRGHVIGP